MFRRLFILLITIMVVGMGRYPLSAQFSLVDTVNEMKLPFQFVNNLVIIPVTVNGVSLNCILDSGAGANIIFTTQSGDIPFQNPSVYNIGGLGSDTAATVISSRGNFVSIGKEYIDTNSTLYILNDTSLNPSTQIGVPIHGIIGVDFFEKHLVAVDFVKKEITIAKHTADTKRWKQKYNSLPMSIDNKLPSIAYQLVKNDRVHTVRLIIDMGNSDALWLLRDSIISMDQGYVPYRDYLGKGISGAIMGERIRIPYSTLGDIDIYQTILCIPDDSSSIFITRTEDGLMGNEILRRFHIIFDYRNKLFYFKKNKYFKEHYTVNNSGISVIHDGTSLEEEIERLPLNNRINSKASTGDVTVILDDQAMVRYKFVLRPIYKVQAIRAWSPAYHAGILTGDELININGYNIKKLSLEQINEILYREEGEKIRIKCIRNGKTISCTFRLDDPLPVWH